MAQSKDTWQSIGKLVVKTKHDGRKYFAGKIAGKNGKDVQVCVVKKNADYILYKKSV